MSGADSCCPSTEAGYSTAASSPTTSDASSSVGTTIIVRHIDRRATRTHVLKSLDEHGFASRYDFVYCPLDYSTRRGFGYVLLNFVSAADAFRFRAHFGRLAGAWPSGCPRSDLELIWPTEEDRQGLVAHVARYRNSPVMHHLVPDEFKPATFSNGQRVQFPRKTDKIEAPTKLPRSVWTAWRQERTEAMAAKATNKFGSPGKRHFPDSIGEVRSQDASNDVNPLKLSLMELVQEPVRMQVLRAGGDVDIEILSLRREMGLLIQRFCFLEESRQQSSSLGFRPPPGLKLTN